MPAFVLITYGGGCSEHANVEFIMGPEGSQAVFGKASPATTNT